MKIFLDTLDTTMISKYAKMGVIQGVTTNPTLAKRFNMSDDIDMVQKVNQALNGGEVHVEAFGDTKEEIVKNAERILGKCKGIDLVFKIPFIEEGVAGARILVERGHKTSLHLVYSLNQALVAAVIGSTYICPLAGRLDDIGHDALSNIEDMLNAFKTNGLNTNVMVSSVRHPQHVIRAFNIGADVVTVPLNVLQQMFRHPLTDYGVDTFRQDIDLMKPVGSRNIDRKLIAQENDTLQNVLSILASNRAGAVAVCSGQHLAGIFTTGDLKRIVQGGEDSFSLSDSISKYITKKPIAIDINEQTMKAIELVKEHGIEQLVVLDNGTVIGILDAKELL